MLATYLSGFQIAEEIRTSLPAGEALLRFAGLSVQKSLDNSGSFYQFAAFLN